MAVACLPLAMLFRRDEPGRAALADARAADDGWTLRQAMRTPHFWLLSLVYVFTGLGSFLVALHQLAFAVDIGFDKLYAAGVLALKLSEDVLPVWNTLKKRLGRRGMSGN